MDKSKDAPRHMDEADFLPPTVPGANNGAMKLLAFWPDLAEVWFTQADTQFVIKAVTVSKTKFYQAVAFLPQEVAVQLCQPDLFLLRICAVIITALRQGCQLQEVIYSLGKLAVWQLEVPVQPAGSVPVLVLSSVPDEVCCSSLLFLRDILSDRDFLVDSGFLHLRDPWPQIYLL